LLAAAGAASRGECSTLAGRGEDGRTIGAQTWDWHQELSDCWAVLSYPDAPLPFVTLTEPAMLAKIGLNAAGVGLLFNILGHRRDTGAGGVPVHAVARRILDSARTVDAAIDILHSAPLSASSSFTVLDADRIACLEAGPAGVAEVAAAGAWIVRTNHFLDPALAAGGLPVSADSDTVARAALLESRLAGGCAAGPADRLFELLCAHESDGAALCCHPPADGPLGTRWQSLATVQLEPAARTLTVLAGGPCQRPAGQGGAEQRRFQIGAGQPVG
jgi:isopenicillin-N N-acyltransferase-like protein